MLKTELPELAIDGTDLAHEEYLREKARCLEDGKSAPKRSNVFDMFDRAIANSQAGIPTILDMGASMENIGKMLTDYLQKKNISCPTFVAATYLPLEENIRRMEARNQAALAEGGDPTNKRDIWYSANAISRSFGAPLPDDRNPQFVETLHRDQILRIADEHGPNPIDFPKEKDNFFKNFAFDKGQETADLFSRGARCDKIYRPLVPEHSAEIAADIAANMRQVQQAFNSRISTSSFDPSRASLGASITEQDRGQGKGAGSGTDFNI